MTATRDYTPIDCALVDELQLRALRGSEVRVTWRLTSDSTSPSVAAVGAHDHTRIGRIADVRSRDGAEWLIMDDGTTVRLDDLVAVDGIDFNGSC